MGNWRGCVSGRRRAAGAAALRRNAFYAVCVGVHAYIFREGAVKSLGVPETGFRDNLTGGLIRLFQHFTGFFNPYFVKRLIDVLACPSACHTQRNASTYWAVLKKRLVGEGADQLLTNCKQLKLKAADGKRYNADVASTEQLLRIIQSIHRQKPSRSRCGWRKLYKKCPKTHKKGLQFSYEWCKIIKMA
jgi:hypothetical protein